MKPPITAAIADDHQMFRNGVIAVVERLNVRVVAEASNGKELLETLGALENLPRICILDMNMPVMNGRLTLLAIMQRWPEIKVLMLTMLDSEATARKMLQEG